MMANRVSWFFGLMGPTVLQVALVYRLRHWEVVPRETVGHSSGGIGMGLWFSLKGPLKLASVSLESYLAFLAQSIDTPQSPTGFLSILGRTFLERWKI